MNENEQIYALPAFNTGTAPTTPRLSALHNLIKGAMLAVDNNDRVTAKAVLTNAEQMVLAMMEQGK